MALNTEQLNEKQKKANQEPIDVGEDTQNMKLQKYRSVLFQTSSHFVGWVEPTPDFVGFRYTQPNLHFAVGILKFKTQQRRF